MATASASHLTIRDGTAHDLGTRWVGVPHPTPRAHVEIPAAVGRALMAAPVNLGYPEGSPRPPELPLPVDWVVVGQQAPGGTRWYLELPAAEAGHVPAVLARFGGAA